MRPGLGMVVLGLAAALFGSGQDVAAVLLIDDFSSDAGSALGTQWQTFTDQVMGGVSAGQASAETLGGKRCLRLRGRVSLENQGGFIQAALPLVRRGGTFDAGAYRGLRLLVRGNGEDYYIHLRTEDTRLPWQYYEAAFRTGPDWTAVEIPFSAFTAENLAAALDTRKLTRLAVVAAKKAFAADVAVARIEIYK
jgi:Complex I intermediate-associated protein 30 (CIA30)